MGQPGGEERTGELDDRADRPPPGDPRATGGAGPSGASGPPGDPGTGPARWRTGRISAVRALVRALPVLLVVGGTFYDYFTPGEFTAAPLFTAATLVAAPLYSLRGTVLTGAAAVGALILVHLRLGIVLRVDAVTEVVTVATAAVLGILINILVRRSDERLASVREIAEFAQRAVLPEPQARIDGLDVAARYEAAQADASIGGDLYAVQDTPYGVRLVVGDVRGKGMTAVAAVAVVIGAFREAAEQETTLEAVAQRLERALKREGTRRDNLDAVEGFTTAVLAEIPHEGETVRIVNRGHPPPLMLHPDGTLVPLTGGPAALPLGMSDLGSTPDRAVPARFPRGAILLLHTDGLSEARDVSGEFYDPAARLAGRVFPGPDALLNTLAVEVRKHTGGALSDDMALLAVRRG
ncbi:PP2C family protein-serine/threonine phosphatase [Streptomyces sp. NPDC051362]|uniref:PP2C family protein-serine/threonine phosphatase n=1 Tax=Streptomyces sp. NPDC051362 TaxID=3365651 RepID=UPI00378D292D